MFIKQKKVSAKLLVPSGSRSAAHFPYLKKWINAMEQHFSISIFKLRCIKISFSITQLEENAVFAFFVKLSNQKHLFPVSSVQKRIRHESD